MDKKNDDKYGTQRNEYNQFYPGVGTPNAPVSQGKIPTANQTNPPSSYQQAPYSTTTYPPTFYPSTTYPPTSNPPATYPPASYPPGTCPPASYPHTTYPPASYPSTSYPKQSYPTPGYPAQSYPQNQLHPPQYPSYGFNVPSQPNYPQQPYPCPNRPLNQFSGSYSGQMCPNVMPGYQHRCKCYIKREKKRMKLESKKHKMGMFPTSPKKMKKQLKYNVTHFFKQDVFGAQPYYSDDDKYCSSCEMFRCEPYMTRHGKSTGIQFPK